MSAVGVAPHAGRSWQEEVARVRAEARSRFLPFADAMNPGVRERDRWNTPIAHDLFARAGDIGLVGFSLPPELGGEGRDKFEWGIVLEELATVARDPAFSVLLDMSVAMVDLIHGSGRPDLVERYAGRLASGEWIATPGLYESRDPHDFASTAREHQGRWVLNGAKPFVAGARIADMFIVCVRDEATNDLLGFVVERDDPGVTTSALETMGARALGFGQLTLCDVRLPEDRLIWRADALSRMNSYARNRRLMTAATLVGSMDALVARCVERLGRRIRGGRPVLDYPNVERSVGEMRVAVETSRAIVHRALDATRGLRDEYFDSLATAAKHHAAEAALRVGQLVMNLHGGEGYMTAQPWERYMRDMLGMIGGQGSQEVLLIQLGQRTVVELDGRQAREESAGRRVARLAAGAWALATVGAALDGGAEELPAPARDVLAAAGLEELPDGAVAAEVQATLRAAGELFDAAREGALDGESVGVLAAAGDAETPAGRLQRSAAAFAVLAAALELGVLDELAAGGGGDERMLEVLADAGLVRGDAVDPGFAPALVSRARRSELAGEARAALARRAGPLARDPDVDRVHEGMAAACCQALFDQHAAGLEGLDELLGARAPRAAVAGAGGAALAEELRRWVPALEVAGPDAPAGPLALAVVATAFEPREALAAELARLRDALAPGGWVVLLGPRAPRDKLGAAVARLRTAVSGGDPSLDAGALLRDAGFPLVRALSADLVAARRLG